jgi:hypothetical protein
LPSAGDLWAWLLDSNRQRVQQGSLPIVGYQALCRELTARGPTGELSTVGARSVLSRYSDVWFQAAKRPRNGEPAGCPRRKRRLVPIRYHNGTFLVQGRRVRLPVAKGHPPLWVRLARPISYPANQVRAVTLLADGGRLWLAVTAAATCMTGAGGGPAWPRATQQTSSGPLGVARRAQPQTLRPARIKQLSPTGATVA